MWSEPKVLAKGFSMAVAFDLDWSMARSKLSTGHPLLLLASHPQGLRARILIGVCRA